jgi:acyl-CoA thioesterase-1
MSLREITVSVMKRFLNISNYGYGALIWAGKALSLVLVSVSLIVAAAGAHADEKVTIAALGDSLTQGYGLLQNDGFTAQLQDWLDAAGLSVTILNAGVSGDTTAGGLSRVQ